METRFPSLLDVLHGATEQTFRLTRTTPKRRALRQTESRANSTRAACCNGHTSSLTGRRFTLAKSLTSIGKRAKI